MFAFLSRSLKYSPAHRQIGLLDSQEVVPPSQSKTQDCTCLFCLLTLAQEDVSLELLQSDRDLEGKVWTTQRHGSPSLVLFSCCFGFFPCVFMSVLCLSAHSILKPKGTQQRGHSQMLLTTDGPSNWCLLRMLWARPRGEGRGTGGVSNFSSALGSENCMSSWPYFQPCEKTTQV